MKKIFFKTDESLNSALNKAGVKTIRSNKVCPISGRKIVYLQYGGKTVRRPMVQGLDKALAEIGLEAVFPDR